MHAVHKNIFSLAKQTIFRYIDIVSTLLQLEHEAWGWSVVASPPPKKFMLF